MMGRRDLTAVGDLIDAVLGKVAGTSVAPIVRLRRAWPEVAGEWAERCRPVGLKGGVMTVEVPSGMDASVLRYDADRLLAAVTSHLGGSESYTRLSIRVASPRRVQND